MKSALFLYGFFIVSLVACKKPVAEAINEPLKLSEHSATFYISLADTLPQKTSEALQLGDVTGIKLTTLSGHDIRYFHYRSNSQDVLKALSNSPFTRTAIYADTLCRKVEYTYVEGLRATLPYAERDASSFFWNNVSADLEYYESVKPPLKHLIIINKSSNDIYHRVELI